MRRNKTLGMRGAVLLVASILALALLPGAWAEAKFKTLYDFSGSKDGEYPVSDLIFDQSGNLYGTNGGADTAGTVFKLTPSSDGSWTESVLYSFCSLTKCADGASSYAGLIFDAAGNLYGTTVNGGASGGGVVFKLAPNGDGSWTESVLYDFCSVTKCADGAFPAARLIFDQTGNLFGTTVLGGAHDCGIVFQLTSTGDSRWKEKVLHHFTGGKDGASPSASLIFDATGNLYSTIFQLMQNSNGSWKKRGLYDFCLVTNCADGSNPMGGLLFDAAGNMYGVTESGGAFGAGTVFKMTAHSDAVWAESVVYSFCSMTNCADGTLSLRLL